MPDAEESHNSDRLLYLGHASLRITTQEGKVIYIDPYAGEDYSKPADLVLVTHEHYDHNNVAKVQNRNEDIKIITHSEALDTEGYHIFDFGYVKVEAVEAGYNKNHDKRVCVGYILTLNSGISIYVAGDTSTTPQMDQLSAYDLDYSFMPTDGIYNMPAEEATLAADKVSAKHSVPYHTNPDVLFDQAIADRFTARNKLEIHPGEEIVLQKEQ